MYQLNCIAAKSISINVMCFVSLLRICIFLKHTLLSLICLIRRSKGAIFYVMRYWLVHTNE